MNFLRKNLFLKLIKEFQKRKPLNRDTWQHQGVPCGMLTSAVGPADVSVDRSTLTGQRSRVKGQESTVNGPHWSASP
jgi:hypothetical protein